MKLLSSLVIAASAYRNLGQGSGPTPNQPEQCFAQHVDIDGNLFRTNVVEEFEDVYKIQDCQRHCQQYRSQGCQYFVWEENDFDCTLYNGLSGLEYDEDDQGKWMGPVDGCLGCHRQGWDYIVDRAPKNNLVGNSAVHGVANVFKCAQICYKSSECEFVSYNRESQECFLKNGEATQADAAYDTRFQTSKAGCTQRQCVLENRNYENGWVTRYDIITRKVSGSIPGVASPTECQQICQHVKECGFFTWDRDDNHCYIVKSDYYLEPSDDKVSGSRDCIDQSTGVGGFDGMTQWG